MEGHERDGSEPEASVEVAAPEDGGDPGTRAGAAVAAVTLPALWLWSVRDQWRIAVPAVLLACLAGLIGGGIYRFAVERRREPSGLTGWFVAVAATVTLAGGSAAWFSGDWRGWHTVLGAVTAGAAVGCWLVFLRIALWGLPEAGSASGRR